MIFARIGFLVFLAIVLVEGTSLGKKYSPRSNEIHKLMDSVQAVLKFAVELKKLPGFSDIAPNKCVSVGDEKCFDLLVKAITTLFMKGYEPWNIPRINPLRIPDFKTTLPSAVFNFENVELTGFDTIRFNHPEESVDNSINKPVEDNYNMDLTVKGKMRMTLTVGNDEHIYVTDFIQKYADLNIVVQNACKKSSWRFQECSESYKINHTSHGAVYKTSSGFMNGRYSCYSQGLISGCIYGSPEFSLRTLLQSNKNQSRLHLRLSVAINASTDITYSDWFNQNINDINLQREELLTKYVKEFVEATMGVYFKLQKCFENNIDGDKLDYLISYTKKMRNLIASQNKF